MTTQPLNWGLLSTANINRALITPLNASKRNRLLAVASRTLDNAHTYAREKKIPRAYGSYEELLADPEIDVIYNPLPNHLHAKWTIKAVEAGKHVLCEKPLALTLDEVDAIEKAGLQNNKIIAEAFMYRHHPQTLKVKELIESGILGKVKLVRGSFSFQMKSDENIRMNPEMGGGALWDIGCYPLSYARTMLGVEPVEVFGWQDTGRSKVDETLVAQMKFPGEVFAQFDCSFRIPFQTFMVIVGDEASLTIPEPFKPDGKTSLLLARGGKTEKMTVRGGELYIGEVEDMADCILHGKTPRVTLADSRANVRAILALLESARTGKVVAV